MLRLQLLLQLLVQRLDILVDIVPHAWQASMLAEIPGLYVAHIPKLPVIESLVDLALRLSSAGDYTTLPGLTLLPGKFHDVHVQRAHDERMPDGTTQGKGILHDLRELIELERFFLEVAYQHTTAYDRWFDFGPQWCGPAGAPGGIAGPDRRAVVEVGHPRRRRAADRRRRAPASWSSAARSAMRRPVRPTRAARRSLPGCGRAAETRSPARGCRAGPGRVYLPVVVVDPAGCVDRPDAGTRMAGNEPERSETRDDYFAEHEYYLRLSLPWISADAGPE